MKAATNGHKEICELLIEKGCDPFLKDNRGFTADNLAGIYQKQLGIDDMLKDAMTKLD